MNSLKTALIVGMARSGIASARLLTSEGWHLVLNDSRTEVPELADSLPDVRYIDALGKDPADYIPNVDLVVVSPGVSLFQPFVEEARAAGVEVVSEIELGWRYAKGEFLCITGTNGKTTCTALTGEIFKSAGRNTFVLGNIGTPITQRALETREGDVIVAETAALQLEGNVFFHAKAAAVCNITEDHLDRFLTMENYIAAKCKIFGNQTADDFAILNYDDPVVRDMAAKTPARTLFFSRRVEVKEGVYLSGQEVRFRFGGREGLLCLKEEIRIPGAHNLENAMLCACIALSRGVGPAVIRETLMTFPGVEHRIEFACERRGVRYINDSKGTNPDSTIKAVAAMDRPTVLILGGYDKHSSFDELFAVIMESRVKAAVALGVTAEKIMDAAKRAGFTNIAHCAGGFKEAVDMARALAAPGDTVLLSPACASWDMFDNFEQRGRVFKDIVSAYPA
ncbi:MAG TPA: UDP-N-acetylmuramoyl-L-alanine--D-glutamate ligase [Feifaniaceae bacterium]|nr:UDP-N-acetylmuramoyl-L-alanine--D-glutamate ligase [Feifaniaceae bacterium]